MAEITIEVPDEIAEAIAGAGTLAADEVEMRDLIQWNVRTRADELVGWAEADGNEVERAAIARRISRQLDALTQAYAGIVGGKVAA
jgi:hypothetical protein